MLTFILDEILLAGVVFVWTSSDIRHLLKLQSALSYVNPNPGPTADPCGICLKGCRKNQRAVQCDGCDIWYHAKCIHVGKNMFYDVWRPAAAWSCSKCLFPLLQEMDFQYTAYISSTQHYADQSDVQSAVYLKRGMKIARLNTNRLLSKVDGVRELLIKYKLDILALSEMWLITDISDDEINIPGYLIARKDRSISSKLRGGGVMFYVSENIHFTQAVCALRPQSMMDNCFFLSFADNSRPMKGQRPHTLTSAHATRH